MKITTIDKDSMKRFIHRRGKPPATSGWNCSNARERFIHDLESALNYLLEDFFLEEYKQDYFIEDFDINVNYGTKDLTIKITPKDTKNTFFKHLKKAIIDSELKE